MLSHDNYVWVTRANQDEEINRFKQPDFESRMISFLPLNHVAAQYFDLFLGPETGSWLFFADANALKGSLINYMLEVRPTIFLAVPRVWEKLEEKLRAQLESKFVFKYAQSYGTEGTDAQMKGKSVSYGFQLMNKLVYSKVKEAIGLDQAVKLFSGAAPLPLSTRQFFFSLNMFINNTFGMSETTAPMTTTLQPSFPDYDLRSAGKTIPGSETTVLITEPNSNKGELCFRGRNIFMGYLKNPKATKETVDSKRRVHSGDEGTISPNGTVTITGRLKEIIMTSGGENVAPVPIEEQIKKHLPFISNALVIGDQRKYIAAMLAFKVNMLPTGKPTQDLAPEALAEFEKFGIKGVATVGQAAENPLVKKAIQSGIDKTNQVAVSSAAKVKDWFVIPEDFSVAGGEFTPTMKLKRSEIVKKHIQQITQVYSKQSL